MAERVWVSSFGSTIATFQTQQFGTISVDINVLAQHPQIAGISSNDVGIISGYHECQKDEDR